MKNIIKYIIGIFVSIGLLGAYGFGAYTGSLFLQFSPNNGTCSFTKMRDFTFSTDLIKNTDKTFGLGLFMKKGKVYNNDFYVIQLIDSQKSKNILYSLTGSLNKDNLIYDLKIDLTKLGKYNKDKLWFNIKFGYNKKATQACSFAINYSSYSPKALDENDLSNFYTGNNWSFNIGNNYSFYNCKNRFCFEKDLLISRNYDYRKIYGFNSDKQNISFESTSSQTYDYLKTSLKKGSCILLVDQYGKGYTNKLIDFAIDSKQTYKKIYKFNLNIGVSKDCGLDGNIKEEVLLKNANYKYIVSKVFFSGTGFKIGGSVLKLASIDSKTKKINNKYFVVDDCIQTNYLQSIGTGGVVFVRPLKESTNKSDYKIFDISNYQDSIYLMKNGVIFDKIKFKYNSKKCDNTLISKYFKQIYQNPSQLIFEFKEDGLDEKKHGNVGVINDSKLYLTKYFIEEIINNIFDSKNQKILFIDKNLKKPIMFEGIKNDKPVFIKNDNILTICGVNNKTDQSCTKDNRLLDSIGLENQNYSFVLQDFSGNYSIFNNFDKFPIKLNKIKTIKYLENGDLVFVGGLLTGENMIFKFPNHYYKIGNAKLESIELLDNKIVVITENKIYKISNEMFVSMNSVVDILNPNILSGSNNEFTGNILELSGGNNDSITGALVKNQSSSTSSALQYVCKIGNNIKEGVSQQECDILTKQYQINLSANLYSANIISGYGWSVVLILFLIIGGYLLILRIHPDGNSIAHIGIKPFLMGILGLFMFKYENTNFNKIKKNNYTKNITGKVSEFFVKLVSLKNIFKKQK